MAILCLSKNIDDLKERVARVTVGYTYDDRPVTVRDLKIQGAVAAVLKDALKPNLVQTLEHTPVFIHGGPFANIAHGCNSIMATKMALKLADVVVTEAGFAADLGAEKFLDIKCRKAGLTPAAVVIVATVRALKYHGLRLLQSTDFLQTQRQSLRWLRKNAESLALMLRCQRYGARAARAARRLQKRF